MGLLDIMEWLFMTMETMIIYISLFMISRYIFLEPSLEERKQKKFYLYGALVVFALCVFMPGIASISACFLCALNIFLARKEHKIVGFLSALPISGFLNGIYIPTIVVPVNLFQLEQLGTAIYSVIFYGLIYAVLLIFYLKGKDWRRNFQEELKYRKLQNWEKGLLWAVGILLMIYSASLSTIPEMSSETYQTMFYELTIRNYLVTGITSFALTITVIVLIMQGNKRSYYYEKALTTQKAEMEKEKAEAANKAKSNFLSSMSHEIRTPMNAIVGMTEVLLRGEHSNETIEYLNNIKVSGDALLTIINDILDFSKIESGKMDIVEGEYNPKTMINALKMIFENRALGKPIELIYDVDENIPAVLLGDEHRLRQIIINLVNNAIKFTDKGYVKVSVESNVLDDEKVELLFAVEDTGDRKSVV